MVVFDSISHRFEWMRHILIVMLAKYFQSMIQYLVKNSFLLLLFYFFFIFYFWYFVGKEDWKGGGGGGRMQKRLMNVSNVKVWFSGFLARVIVSLSFRGDNLEHVALRLFRLVHVFWIWFIEIWMWSIGSAMDRNDCFAFQERELCTCLWLLNLP